MHNFDNPREILVLAENGLCAAPLLDTLTRTYAPFPAIHIRPITSDELRARQNISPQETIAFFLPGGWKANYDARLGEDGFQILRDYVQDGGAFVGICAGAFYASSKMRWQPSPDILVEKNPSLSFFNGLSAGPARLTDNPHSDGSGSWHDASIASVTCYDTYGAFQAHCLHWGGPRFYPEAEDRLSPLATFNQLDNTPCILSGTFGAGLVTLSSVHPEITSKQIAATLIPEFTGFGFDHAHRLAEELEPHERGRQRLWGMMISGIATHRRNLFFPHSAQENKPLQSDPESLTR
ncbi:MAG: hypothetical protein H6855_03495 [Rhodospirillales bacterium]|nr:hypothetical protein [Rhodospirillales bacterium]